MKFDGIIFDLDGTLWDSTAEVAKTWTSVIAKYNLNRKEVTVEDLKPCMGKLLDEIASILLPELDPKKQMQVIKECCEYENKYLGEYGATLYDKLEDTLKELSYENKKASTVPPVKANKENIKSNNSIPQNDLKDTDKNEKNKESEIVEIINNSCVNIRKQDLKKCEEEFTDIDKLKKALEICEINIASGKKSHGIKALRLAYKYGDRSSNTNADNDKRKGSIYMADSKVDVNGELKSVEDMSSEDIAYKLDLKNGTNWSGRNPNAKGIFKDNF